MNPSPLRFASESDYRAALIEVIGQAQSAIRILDLDLQRMALHTPNTCDQLSSFLQGGEHRSIDIAVHHPNFILGNASRLVNLSKSHPQSIRLRQIPTSLQHLADCHLLADAIHGVRRFHHAFPRGALSLGAAEEINPWWRRFEELWEVCTPVNWSGISGL